MASRTVDITLTVAQARALQNLLAVNNAITGLGQSLDTMAGKGKRGAGETARSLGDVVKQAGKSALAFLGVGTALQALNTLAGVLRNELEKIKSVRIESADRQFQAGREIEQFRLRTGGVFRTTQEQTRIIEEISDSRGDLTQAEAVRAAGVGISAGSGETTFSDGSKFGARERALAAVRVANVLRAHDQETVDSTIAALTAQVEVFGGSGSAREIIDAQIGTFSTAQAFSPSIQPKALAQNIFAGAAQLGNAQLGFSQQEALSIMLGVQGSTRDVEAATTRTNIINQAIRSMVRVSQVRPELRGRGAAMFRFLSAEGEFARDPQAIKENQRLLGALSNAFSGEFSEEERDQVLAGSADRQLEARAKGLIGAIQLFQAGDNETKRKIRAARKEVLFGPEAAAFTRRQLSERGTGTAAERAFEGQRAADRSRDILLSQHEGRGRSGQILKMLEDLGPLVGQPALVDTLSRQVESLSGVDDPAEVTRRQIDILRRARGAATTRRVAAPTGQMPMFGGSTPASLMPTQVTTVRRPDETAQLANQALSEQIGRLETILAAILAEQQSGLRVNVENDRTRANQTPSGPGAVNLTD